MRLQWKIGKPLVILTVLGDFEHNDSASGRTQLFLSQFLQSSKYVVDNDTMRWPWIITNPLDGVGKEVGRMVRGIHEKYNAVVEKNCNLPVHCIGVCTWGMVADREQISHCGEVSFTVPTPEAAREQELLALNPYMSRYLFVDDATRGVRSVDRYAEKMIDSYREPR